MLKSISCKYGVAEGWGMPQRVLDSLAIFYNLHIKSIKVKLFLWKRFIRPSNYCSVNVPLCDRGIRPVRALSALCSTFSSVINSDSTGPDWMRGHTGQGVVGPKQAWASALHLCLCLYPPPLPRAPTPPPSPSRACHEDLEVYC